MNSTVETLDDNKVKLSVEVDEQEFDVAVDAAFKRLAREVRIPGFRPGKAPRRLLEAQFGHQVGREEALREALPDYYARAVVEHDVDVIASPEIEITGGQESGPVQFDAVVEVRPQVNAAGYNGLQVTIDSPTPTDEEVEEHTDLLRRQFAELEPVDRPAVDGDHVTIDITGSVDGEEIPGLTTSDYDYEVGSGAVVAEIDDNLRGAKPGDILEFDAEHPDPDEDAELHFRILVKDVKHTVLPDLTDEFASQNSEFETVEELQADIRQRLSTMKIAQARMMLQQRTVERLAELVDDDPPEAMVNGEINARLEDFATRLHQQGVDLQSHLDATGQSIEDLVGEFREPAQQAVRVDLALRAVATAEELWPDDDEIDAEIERIIAENPPPPAKGKKNKNKNKNQPVTDLATLRANLTESGQISVFSADLAKRAALEWLTEHVAIVDDDGNTIERDLLEFPEADADEDDSSDDETADTLATDADEDDSSDDETADTLATDADEDDSSDDETADTLASGEAEDTEESD